MLSSSLSRQYPGTKVKIRIILWNLSNKWQISSSLHLVLWMIKQKNDGLWNVRCVLCILHIYHTHISRFLVLKCILKQSVLRTLNELQKRFNECIFCVLVQIFNLTNKIQWICLSGQFQWYPGDPGQISSISIPVPSCQNKLKWSRTTF